MRQLAARLLFVLMAAWLPWTPVAVAQDVTQSHVKAALVYNFIMYTDWPVFNWNTDIPLMICVSPKSELRDALPMLQAKTVHNRRVRVKLYTENSDIGACDVLYIDSRSFVHWPQFKKNIVGKSVLTIASDDVPDSEGFIISLVIVDNRMAFEIDSRAAQQAPLSFSSKLLRLARRVH